MRHIAAITLFTILACADRASGSYEYSAVDCPRLSIKAGVKKTLRPGQVVSYKIRIQNNLNAPVQHVYIEAELPPYVIYPVPAKREGEE